MAHLDRQLPRYPRHRVAVEIALLDLAAKAAHVSLSTFLGGRNHEIIGQGRRGWSKLPKLISSPLRRVLSFRQRSPNSKSLTAILSAGLKSSMALFASRTIPD